MRIEIGVGGFVGYGLDGDGAVGAGGLGLELGPEFAVFFQAHFFGLAVGIEAEHGLGSADCDGKDVPDVEGDDVSGDEVGVVGGVDGASFADGVGGAGFVGLGADGFGALDLNAPETFAVVEDEIVTETVAPGLGDAESEGGGAVEEGGFGTLSGLLGVGAAWG